MLQILDYSTITTSFLPLSSPPPFFWKGNDGLLSFFMQSFIYGLCIPFLYLVFYDFFDSFIFFAPPYIIVIPNFCAPSNSIHAENHFDLKSAWIDVTRFSFLMTALELLDQHLLVLVGHPLHCTLNSLARTHLMRPYLCVVSCLLSIGHLFHALFSCILESSL